MLFLFTLFFPSMLILRCVWISCSSFTIGQWHFSFHASSMTCSFFFITSLRYTLCNVFGHSCLHVNSKGHRQRFSRMWRTISFFVEDWDCEREGKIKINKISKDKRIEEDKRKYPSGRKILIKTFVSILCLTIGFSEPNIKLQVCVCVRIWLQEMQKYFI